MGNFLAVGGLSLFQVAPVKRRCWGFFRENSFDYKRFVGRAAQVSVVLSFSSLCRLSIYMNHFEHVIPYNYIQLHKKSWSGSLQVAVT